MISSTVIYESFNARNLAPEDVAKTFVVPDEFSELLATNHVVLMGPRGSGKTTMLKMLTLRALTAWKDPLAERFRTTMNFDAVYIPTDIHWHHQLSQSEKAHRKFPELERFLETVAVTTNILFALAEAMRDRVALCVDCDESRDRQFCTVLISVWKLPSTLPIFPAVLAALAARLSDAYIAIANARSSSSLDDAIRVLPDYFHLDYLAAARAACTAFEGVFSYTRKWALCFDELELAPKWLQNRLFGELRSTYEGFLFKLSTSPLPELGDLHSAGRQDFGVIRLWSDGSRSQRAFCERLLKSILDRSYSESVLPEELFGSSVPQSEDSSYSRGSMAYKMFKELAVMDAGFRSTLTQNGISSTDPYTANVSTRDQVLRKAKPIVLQRLAFVKQKGDKTARRSRKVYNIYYGTEAIYAISDGNPRWLYGIVVDMLASVKPGKKGGPKPIPNQQQERILRVASAQFHSFLKTVPVGENSPPGGRFDLESLLRGVGEFFFESIVLSHFILDPFGSFIVDDRVPPRVVELIRIAAYHGAVVLVDPGSPAVFSNPRGHRFRLTYLLAPEFRLPLRLYKAAHLSRVLSRAPGRQRGRKTERNRGPQSRLPLRSRNEAD